jgi:hypothetical protein
VAGHTKIGQFLVDAGLAIATAGGDRSPQLPGVGDDRSMAGGEQRRIPPLRRVRA